MGKKFIPIRALAKKYRLSELKIWALARTGWKGKYGAQKHIEQFYDPRLGASFAEDDLIEWINTHEEEYETLLVLWDEHQSRS